MKNRPTILVVDDEEDIRHLVEVVLTSTRRWNVVCADCGDQAIEIARRELPALILLDRRMPNGDGLTTFLRLREHPSTRDTPVVLMTAHTRTAIPPGFAGLIAKPFDPMLLLERVGALLHAHQTS